MDESVSWKCLVWDDPLTLKSSRSFAVPAWVSHGSKSLRNPAMQQIISEITEPGEQELPA